MLLISFPDITGIKHQIRSKLFAANPFNIYRQHHLSVSSHGCYIHRKTDSSSNVDAKFAVGQEVKFLVVMRAIMKICPCIAGRNHSAFRCNVKMLPCLVPATCSASNFSLKHETVIIKELFIIAVLFLGQWVICNLWVQHWAVSQQCDNRDTDFRRLTQIMDIWNMHREGYVLLDLEMS